MGQLQNVAKWTRILYQSIAFRLLMTAFSVILYVQDILQDVLIITATISSEEVYNVLSDFEIAERKLGYFMAFMFGLR